MYTINKLFKTRISYTLMAILLLPLSGHAGLHKWVDEKGQIHYGDRIPAKYMRKEHSVLTEQGVTIQTNKALKTDEQISEEEKQRIIKAEQERKRLIQARKKALRDRVLLDTFTTEKDLILARDARTEAVDSQLSLAETLIKHDEKKLEGVRNRIQSIEKSGRIAPENLHKEVIAVGRQLENNYAYVEDKQNERKEIIRSFNEDIKRFRELMEAKRKARQN